MSFADVELKLSGMFLKLEVGKPATLRLLQDSPVSRTIHGFGKAAVECVGNACAGCASDDQDFKKSKQRFKINIYSHDQQKVMIFEFGAAVIRQLKTTEKNLVAQGLKITDIDLIIDASGEKTQRKYQVTPMIKSREVPQGLVLHNLESDLLF